MKSEIPVLRPLLPSAERLLPYLRRIDARRVYTNHGPLMTEFRERMAALLGVPGEAFVPAATGTAGIVGGLLASCGRGGPAKPVVLMPAFTFVATAIAVETCGYRPHLVDIDEDDWTFHAGPLAERIGPDVAAVIPVAPFGRAVAQAPWLEFRRRTGVPVVIDGAASFDIVGAAPRDYIGALPVAFSFHATKSFSTGEGGAVVTTDLHLAERVTQSLNFGFCGDRNARVASINGKLSEYHAAVGLAELDDWPQKRAALIAVANAYAAAGAAAGVGDRLLTSPVVSSTYVIFRARDTAESVRVRNVFDRERVGYRLWYGAGVHRQAYFSGSERDKLDVTEGVGETLVGLPVAPDLDTATIERVVALIAATCAETP